MGAFAAMGAFASMGSIASMTASLASTTASLASTASTGSSTTATGAASGSLRLDEAGVKVNRLLHLALTLALLLATGAGEVNIVLLLERLSVGPLLIELASLVGGSDVKVSLEASLLLRLLDEVVVVRDALILGLSGLLSSGVLGLLILLLRLGNGLTGLLVLKLGIAFGGTPRLGSLLIGASGGTGLVRVFVVTLTGESTATASTDASTLATARSISRGLLGGTALVAFSTSGAITESTLVSAGTTTAVAASPHRGLGSLRLDIALSSASCGLVDGLDGDDGLLLAVGVVAKVGEPVLGGDL